MTLSSRYAPAARVIAVAIALAAASVGSAFAIDGFGPAKPIHVCKTGYVFAEKTKMCVKVDAGLLDDDALFEQGRALAKSGHYGQALAVLGAVRDQQDSMVLTMIGYSKRKIGQWDEGLADYRQALAVDTNNVNAREYLGEAYVEAGQVDLAKAELIKIETACGVTCEPYRDLAEAIGNARM